MRTDLEGLDDNDPATGPGAADEGAAGRSCRVVLPLGDDLSPLEPLLAHLRANEPTDRPLAFPRGVLLEDGRLDLCKQGVGASGASALRRAIRGNDTVRDLLLGADHLGPEGAGEIASIVEERGGLRTVYLGCNAMGDEGAAALARALRADGAVRGLWLKRNGIGPAGARALAAMLAHNRALRTLDLVSNRLGPAGVDALAGPLRGDNRTLQALYLCDNALGDAASALARLPGAPALRALFLGGNALGDAGARALAPALEATSLEVLSLSSNGIGARGLDALLGALHRHPTVHTLELGYLRSTEVIGARANALGEDGADRLARWLADGAAVASLDLVGTHLGPDGAVRVAEAALRCPSLTSLALGQRLPPALQSALNAALCQRANRAARDAAPPEPSWRDDVARIRSVYRTARRPAGAPELKAGEAVELTPSALRSLAGQPPAPAPPAPAPLPLPSDDDLARCADVLRQVLAHRGEAAALPALAPVLELVRSVARATRSHDSPRARRRAADLARAQQTGIQRGRRERLAAQLAHAAALPPAPGSLAPAPAPATAPDTPARPPGAGGAAAAGATAPSPGAAALLSRPRVCYVCKGSFRELDAFYDQLCPPCAAHNRKKRAPDVDLTGRTALVTGGRIKIGFLAACLLLRAGARVIVTTRFAGDAARRFASEPDHERWADRLTIEPLDLRLLRDVERFADGLGERLDGLDILVHNAAQTIARPESFYAPLVAREPALLEEPAARRWVPPGAALPLPGSSLGAIEALSAGHAPAVSEWRAAIEGVDEHGQPLDRRGDNSWRRRLGEVDLAELVTCHAVSALAPFVLTGRLRPALVRGARRVPSRPHAFVINVSAVEGQFNRANKTPWHPHTNMAKASLNMMTRTCADDLARDGILMNSVDTGWITNENPRPVAERMSAGGFAPPLDELDGAARVLDPIFSVLAGAPPVWGRFFKDYAEAPW